MFRWIIWIMADFLKSLYNTAAATMTLTHSAQRIKHQHQISSASDTNHSYLSNSDSIFQS